MPYESISQFFQIDFTKVAWSPEVYWYLKSLNLKFQKNWTKIEAVRSLPCLAWEPPNLADWLCLADGNRFLPQTTSILVQFFWNFRFRTYKWWQFFRLHATMIFRVVKWPNVHSYINWTAVVIAIDGRNKKQSFYFKCS